jgi:hypothetical protein
MKHCSQAASQRWVFQAALMLAGICGFVFAILIFGSMAAQAHGESGEPAPTQTNGTMTSATTVVSASDPTISTTAPVSTPAAAQGAANPNVLYADDFTDPGSGWPNALVFGNYYMGYHEPDFYHVEVHAEGDRALATVPQQKFDDFTAKVEMFADAANTAPEGDFRYGLAVRRTGNRFYAFVLSPVTGQWAVLRSDPTGIEVLDSGAEAGTSGRSDRHHIAVDADGPSLTFFVDDQQVSQLQDDTYSSGEIALYVETLDSPRIHTHFDSIEVDKVQKTSQAGIRCKVDAAQYLNLRTKPIPDSEIAPPITTLFRGSLLTATARNTEGSWLRLRMTDGREGWASARYLVCEGLTMQLPVAAP